MTNPVVVQGEYASYAPPKTRDWRIFWPMLLAALIVAVGMGMILWPGMGAPGFSLMLSVPVAAMIVLTVYVSRWTNPTAAAITGVLVMVVYLLAPIAALYIRALIWNGFDLKGALELYPPPTRLLWMIAQTRFPGLAGVCLSVLWIAVHWGLPLVLGYHFGRRMAGRVYYEDAQRWATSQVFSFAHTDLPAVLQGVRDCDWTILGRIAKLPYRRRHDALRIEYLPGTLDHPMYVTVESPWLIRLQPLLIVAPFLGWATRPIVRQRTVSPELADDLVRTIREIAVSLPEDQPEASADGVLAYASNRQPVAGKAVSSAAGSIIAEMGFAGSQLVGSGRDFRELAVQESLGRQPAGTGPQSLCIQAEADGIARLRRTGMVILANAFVVFGLPLLTFLTIPLSIAMAWTRPVLGAGAIYIAYFIGAVGRPVLMGLTLLMIPVAMVLLGPGLKTWLLLQVHRRPDCMIPARRRGIRAVSVEDAKTFHVTKRVPEDIAVLYTPEGQGMLVIEGLAYRYRICAADVVQVGTFKAEGQAVELRYRIGNAELQLVIVPSSFLLSVLSAMAKMPLIGLPFIPLVHLIRFRLLHAIQQSLGQR